MSEFERRKRYLKYNDSECIIFLRKDFNHRCAYCLTREADFGNPNNFEKDHFVPQNGGYVGLVHTKYQSENFDVNSYYNLYYACYRCNGRGGKSNTWSPTLLDPCVDKIWGKHIKQNADLIEFLTPQGKEYIETFQLNSRSARNLREKIRLQNENIIEQIKGLEKLKQESQGNKVIVEYLNSQIEQKNATLKYGIKYLPNDYFYNDKEVSEAETILSKYNLKYLNGDYELDYEIDFNRIKYQIYLRIQDNINFVDGQKIYYLSQIQVQDWKDKNVLICRYDSMNKKLYYIDFSEFLKTHPTMTNHKYMYILEEKKFIKM